MYSTLLYSGGTTKLVVIGLLCTSINMGSNVTPNTYLYYDLISNANDGSGNSRDGTISGTITWNNGAVFNANGRIRSIDSFPTSFTISLFIKKSTGSLSEQVLWAKWGKSGKTVNQYQRTGIHFDSSNTLKVFHATTQSSHQRDSIMTIDTTNWHHIVYTYDNGTVNLYVDKVLKTTFSTQINNSTDSGLGLGGWYDGTNNLYGTEREFIIESVVWNQNFIEKYYDHMISKL